MLVGCKKTEEPVDYSEYAFADIWWTREGAHDEEKIHFGADGTFNYSCACGNPVNDADLCEGYKYDDETKTFTLECIETTLCMIDSNLHREHLLPSEKAYAYKAKMEVLNRKGQRFGQTSSQLATKWDAAQRSARQQTRVVIKYFAIFV